MGEKNTLTQKLPPALLLYRGRWVACLDGQVIGQGGTPGQALRAAKDARYKEKAQIIYVPMQKPFTFSPLFERVREILAYSPAVY